MSRIQSTKTKSEEIVAAYLRENHVGYRRYVAHLPGKPDFVLSRYNAVIFVNGCFWHRHAKCKWATTPKSNSEYWVTKFQKTVERDQKEQAQLKLMGWRVFVIWECELRKNAKYKLNDVLRDILLFDDDVY